MKKSLSQISREYDIPVSTLRYYLRNNVLPFLQQDESGYYYVDEADVLNMHLINLLRNSGCPVELISEVIRLAEASKEDGSDVRSCYLSIVKLIDEHFNNLISDMQSLQRQMQYSQYLRLTFSRYVEAGTSLIEDIEYDGMPDFSTVSSPDEETILKILNAFAEKYPGYPKDDDKA